ncbi:MAG: hypothetical protein NC300_06110 [Bacteroidales bacterium]|nr:hypothetical protein [Clostridium sp.]MCM1203698.1 hypothetical protein [Bacteroidales bacterium]
MAYGELFRHFTIRFSLKKAQHVKLLQWFDDKKLNEGRVKNQVVMDALEMYYESLLAGKEQQGEKVPDYLEKRLSVMKEEIKAELLQEILRTVLGNAITGQPIVASAPIREPETEEPDRDDTADISGMPDVMEKIIGWSEN